MKSEKAVKYEVLRGRPEGHSSARRYPAGHALQHEGRSYFVLKLWAHPFTSYYIVRNNGELRYYTVYGRKVEDADGTVSFQNPIGYARDMPRRMHLEIIIPDYPRPYYMSLYPETVA